MLTKDKILMTVFAVILFLFSMGVVVFTFSDKLSVKTFEAPDVEGNKKNLVKLLPYGSEFNFKNLEKRSIDSQLNSVMIFEYTTLNNSDVGLKPEDMMGVEKP